MRSTQRLACLKYIHNQQQVIKCIYYYFLFSHYILFAVSFNHIQNKQKRLIYSTYCDLLKFLVQLIENKVDFNFVRLLIRFSLRSLLQAVVKYITAVHPYSVNTKFCNLNFFLSIFDYISYINIKFYFFQTFTHSSQKMSTSFYQQIVKISYLNVNTFTMQ